MDDYERAVKLVKELAELSKKQICPNSCKKCKLNIGLNSTMGCILLICDAMVKKWEHEKSLEEFKRQIPKMSLDDFRAFYTIIETENNWIATCKICKRTLERATDFVLIEDLALHLLSHVAHFEKFLNVWGGEK